MVEVSLYDNPQYGQSGNQVRWMGYTAYIRNVTSYSPAAGGGKTYELVNAAGEVLTPNARPEYITYNIPEPVTPPTIPTVTPTPVTEPIPVIEPVVVPVVEPTYTYQTDWVTSAPDVARQTTFRQSTGWELVDTIAGINQTGNPDPSSYKLVFKKVREATAAEIAAAQAINDATYKDLTEHALTQSPSRWYYNKNGTLSMSPTIEGGIAIDSYYIPSEDRTKLKIGDIIQYAPTYEQWSAFGYPNNTNTTDLLIHRIVGINYDTSGNVIGYQLQGDNNTYTDNSFMGNIEPSQIMYKAALTPDETDYFFQPKTTPSTTTPLISTVQPISTSLDNLNISIATGSSEANKLISQKISEGYTWVGTSTDANTGKTTYSFLPNEMAKTAYTETSSTLTPGVYTIGDQTVQVGGTTTEPITSAITTEYLNLPGEGMITLPENPAMTTATYNINTPSDLSGTLLPTSESQAISLINIQQTQQDIGKSLALTSAQVTTTGENVPTLISDIGKLEAEKVVVSGGDVVTNLGNIAIENIKQSELTGSSEAGIIGTAAALTLGGIQAVTLGMAQPEYSDTAREFVPLVSGISMIGTMAATAPLDIYSLDDFVDSLSTGEKIVTREPSVTVQKVTGTTIDDTSLLKTSTTTLSKSEDELLKLQSDFKTTSTSVEDGKYISETQGKSALVNEATGETKYFETRILSQEEIEQIGMTAQSKSGNIIEITELPEPGTLGVPKVTYKTTDEFVQMVEGSAKMVDAETGITTGELKFVSTGLEADTKVASAEGKLIASIEDIADVKLSQENLGITKYDLQNLTPEEALKIQQQREGLIPKVSITDDIVKAESDLADIKISNVPDETKPTIIEQAGAETVAEANARLGIDIPEIKTSVSEQTQFGGTATILQDTTKVVDNTGLLSEQIKITSAIDKAILDVATTKTPSLISEIAPIAQVVQGATISGYDPTKSINVISQTTEKPTISVDVTPKEIITPISIVPTQTETPKPIITVTPTTPSQTSGATFTQEIKQVQGTIESPKINIVTEPTKVVQETKPSINIESLITPTETKPVITPTQPIVVIAPVSVVEQPKPVTEPTKPVIKPPEVAITYEQAEAIGENQYPISEGIKYPDLDITGGYAQSQEEKGAIPYPKEEYSPFNEVVYPGETKPVETKIEAPKINESITSVTQTIVVPKVTEQTSSSGLVTQLINPEVKTETQTPSKISESINSITSQTQETQPNILQGLIPIINVGTATTTTTSQGTSQVTIPDTTTKLSDALKQDTSSITQTAVTQVQIQKQAQQQDTGIRQVVRHAPAYRSFTDRYTRTTSRGLLAPIIPQKKQLPTSKISSSKQAFDVLVRRKGKYVRIAKSLPRGEAIKTGIVKTSTTLARTFKLKPSGTTTKEDIKYDVPTGQYYQSQKEPDTFIERKQFALKRGSGEVPEIQRSKKISSAVGKIKFFKGR